MEGVLWRRAHIVLMGVRDALGERMSRLLLFGVVLCLVVAAGVGHASSKEFNNEIVATDLAGRQTNLTHDSAIDTGPAAR